MLDPSQHHPALQQMNQLNQMNQMSQMNQMNQINQMNSQTNQMSGQMNGHMNSQMNGHMSNPMNGQMNTPMNHLGHMSQMNQMMPPPPKAPMTASNPSSALSSPNVSPPHTYVNAYTSNPGSYMTRNVSGELSPAGLHHPMDINLLATAASQVERETNVPQQHLSYPTRHSHNYGTHPYSHHPYSTGRLPSLSSYHYGSNPTSQPMSRSHSHDDDDPYAHRMTKRSRPASPQSTAPPSPSFSHKSTSPTPDHTPLATPSHSPRLRPQYYHNGVQLPTLNHLSLHNHQPPPALAPVEPSADGQQPYIPTHHSGLRISEIMEREDGAQRKLPIPILPSAMKVNDLLNPGSGFSSGQSSTAGSIAGDLGERSNSN